MNLRENVQKGLRTDFVVRDDEVLIMGNGLCVPNIKEPKNKIIE